jgi:N-acetylglucosaminyldiphosphoundecaprenol N-acetyl-beta-D-mannosaminyltransferase
VNCLSDAPVSDNPLRKITRRPPIAILGVPFDNVTKAEAVALIEQMIASRHPHYLVTPNVDFLVQARRDVELRRILFEAHLVVCDGTPLVWASRMLGNPLPERVAGADLVPLLTEIAARKGYRLFLLGATPQSASLAVARLRQKYPDIIIAGHYSPPFNPLLDMDHDEIKRRIIEARPDLLFVSFGCPKQEKWVAMHYRSLGVPVTAGVGATIDFLAGQVKRAPVWMQRSGTEWIFRLGQEPRRLFRRYFTDLWIFGSSILPQWWQLQARPRRRFRFERASARPGVDCQTAEQCWVRLPKRLDVVSVRDSDDWTEALLLQPGDRVLDMRSTAFVDSTGVGWLIHLQKRVRASGRRVVLFSPRPTVLRALKLMRLKDFFEIATNESDLKLLLADAAVVNGHLSGGKEPEPVLYWRGEITAANAESVWDDTRGYLNRNNLDHTKTIDLTQVRFIDSTGLGLMVRAKKQSAAEGSILKFVGLQPAVRNVLRLSRLEEFLLGPARKSTTQTLLQHK